MGSKPRRPRWMPGSNDRTNFHPESVGDYESGYGKPPVDSQFPPGTSGNPNGRPRGSKNRPRLPTTTANMILEEGNRLVSVTENGIEKKVPITRAVVQLMGRNALQGDKSAQREFIKMQSAAEKYSHTLQSVAFADMLAYCNEARRIQAIRRDEYLSPIRFPLHPDDVVFDFENQTYDVIYLNDEQFDIGKAFAALLDWSEFELFNLNIDLSKATTIEQYRLISKEISATMKVIIKLRAHLGIRWTTEQPEEELPDMSRFKFQTSD